MSTNSERSDPSNPVVDLGEYDGERNEAGERHGYGRAQLPNGDVYQGYYKYGKRNGRGKYTFLNKSCRYEGDYKDGEKHGHGTMIYPDGSQYEGTWDRNIREGYGTYTYVNGDKYEGEWTNDMKNGEGTYQYSLGSVKFKGFWKMGKQEGKGELHFSNLRYIGNFQDNQPVGKGTFYFDDRGVHLEGAYFVETRVDFENDERIIFMTKTWLTDGKLIVTEKD